MILFVLHRAKDAQRELHFTATENLLGDMPLKSRFGYLFTPSLEDAHQTIAHELGHGAFQLRHTFSERYGIEKHSTPNLMDYARGSELTKYQWDIIHDPHKMLFPWMQGEEEGQSHDVKINELITWIKNNKGTLVDLEQHKFYNFNVWVNKALEAKLDGKKTWFYSEVFVDGTVNLKSPNVDFIINEEYHSSFCLSYNYEEKNKEAIRIWTYSYLDFTLLLKELGYDLTENFKRQITQAYINYLANYGTDCNKIDVVFENIPDFVLQKIDLNDRVNYLAILLDCQIFDGGWIWGPENDTDESLAILNLLDINAEIQEDFYKAIKVAKTPDGYSLYEKIIEKFKHDDFTLFAADMLRWMNNSSLNNETQNSIPFICWNDISHTIWDERDYSFNSNGNMDISIKTWWFIEKNGTYNTSNTNYTNISPLQPIAVRIENLSVTESHSTRVISGMKEGDEYVMPAFVFAWMIEQHDKLENKELVKSGILIISMFINFKSLKSAESIFARVFAAGSIVSDMGDMFFVNDNVREKIDKEWRNGIEFLNAWDNITKNYSKITFSYSTLKNDVELFNAFKIAWYELKRNNIDVEVKIGSDNFIIINEFCEINLHEK